MVNAVDPIAEFLALFERARSAEDGDPTAAVLATADHEARPAARVVLIKHVDNRGFVFYTNLASRKAKELQSNPRAALCVYWPSLHKQVRVEGRAEPVSESEADRYFSSRSRGRQIAAWTSKQSDPLGSRRELLSRYLRMKARFAGAPVPRPSFWGGYRLVPDRIEIWHNQLHRLHDRFLYLRREDGWTMERLYP